MTAGVWGTAADGQTVTGRVTTADGLILSEGICTARDGRFLLHLPPMEQATSCTLTVTCGDETRTIGVEQEAAVPEPAAAGLRM